MPVKLLRYIVIFFVASTAFASVWNVPDTVATIQTAIDTATSGDTVLVKASHQNLGPVEIRGKKIALFSQGYMNNPNTYGIASGAALFDTLNTSPLLILSSADSSSIRGFLLDKSDIGNGGGVVVENSAHIDFEGVYLRANSLVLNNSSIEINKTRFYGSDEANYDLISATNSIVKIRNTNIYNSDVNHIIVTGSGTELSAENLAVYKNICSGELYRIGSSLAYFNFFTSYGNTIPGNAWALNSTWVSIENSILEYAPPDNISQCEVVYSSLPVAYAGTGNISVDPMVDLDGAYPALLETSPCISAANPDTTNIPRTDILGNTRPNPEWAPPDMGAYESERHMLKNNDDLLWISTDGDDIWGNGSTEYPFASLQAGIDYIGDGDTLILLPGTYQTNAVVESKSITIASPYIFDRNEAYRDSVLLCPDTSILESILLVRGSDSLKMLGLNLQDGRGREFYNGYTFGGAIYCEDSRLDLEYLQLKNNSSQYGGGAIYARNSDVYMTDVWLEGNLSYFGGALSLYSSTAYFNNVIMDRNAASTGGAIYLENNSKLVSYYSQLTDNEADNSAISGLLGKTTAISQYGGAIYGKNSHLRLHNNFIEGNRSANNGAAIALLYGQLELVQSTIAANSSDLDSAGVIYMYDPTEDVIILNSIVWDPGELELVLRNTDFVGDHSLIFQGDESIVFLGDDNKNRQQSMIYDDPQLDEDYNYGIASPCLNAGIATYSWGKYYLINYDASEYDNSTPHIGDRGAYPDVHFELENRPVSIISLPEYHELLQAYPNPFNPTTTLAFDLASSGETQLSIYDLSGKRIFKLLDNNLQSGQYRLSFNAGSLPSGIYIAQLIQNNIMLSTLKVVLVK